jgi:CheY-like chemotaxis protein
MARILVIDDDAAIRTAVRILLERKGHEVALAPNGAAGLAALRSDRYDVAIVDIFMPGMDGIETIKAMRADQPALPIIVTSGFGASSPFGEPPDFLKMATKLGADFSLAKPFKPSQLLDCIAACLDRRAGDATAARRDT